MPRTVSASSATSRSPSTPTATSPPSSSPAGRPASRGIRATGLLGVEAPGILAGLAYAFGRRLAKTGQIYVERKPDFPSPQQVGDRRDRAVAICICRRCRHRRLNSSWSADQVCRRVAGTCETSWARDHPAPTRERRLRSAPAGVSAARRARRLRSRTSPVPPCAAP